MPDPPHGFPSGGDSACTPFRPRSLSMHRSRKCLGCVCEFRGPAQTPPKTKSGEYLGHCFNSLKPPSQNFQHFFLARVSECVCAVICMSIFFIPIHKGRGRKTPDLRGISQSNRTLEGTFLYFDFSGQCTENCESESSLHVADQTVIPPEFAHRWIYFIRVANNCSIKFKVLPKASVFPHHTEKPPT